MKGFILLSVLAVSLTLEVKAHQDLVQTPKATKLPPDLYAFKVPLPPPPPAPVEEPVVEPAKEPVIPPIRYTDPRPAVRAAQARRNLAERRAKQTPLPIKIGQEAATAEPFYAQDPHYRQWDQQTLEDKFTYPVDRSLVLTADRYLSGVLETEINSQIPGNVIVVIDRPLFTAKDWTVILPQYTKVICEYQPLSKVSDTRLSLKCTRAIRPDGASLMITEAQGTDPMGRNGLVGDIDYRIPERYGSAFLMSAISALAGAGAGKSTNPMVQQGAANLSQNLGQVTAKVIDQYIDLAPLITIEAGTRVHIRPQVDIWLRPPIPKSEAESFKQQQQEQEGKQQ